MGYVPKPETAQWEAPAPFAPWRELSDEEFERLEAEYDAQFPDEKGSMRRWFDHVTDEPSATRKTKGGRAAGGES